MNMNQTVEYDLVLTEKVRNYASELGTALFGVADAGILNEALESGFRPEDNLPGSRSVVVLALHIPDGALESMRRGKSNYSYNLFGYAYLNRELDFLIYRMTCFLENQGYAAMPLPARGTMYGARKPYFGPLSYRHCAVAAGIATFGLNGLALTPEYGFRQRFVGIPTTAPLKPADKLLDQSLCDGCMACIRNCPAHALSLNPPHICRLGEMTYRYATVNGAACTHMSRGLSTKVWPGAEFNPEVDVPPQENQNKAEHYDDLWNKRDARIRTSEHAEGTYGATICGRCMAFCSAGHDAMNRRMRSGQTAFQNDDVLLSNGFIGPAMKIKTTGKEK
jgi:ferredoxin